MDKWTDDGWLTDGGTKERVAGWRRGVSLQCLPSCPVSSRLLLCLTTPKPLSFTFFQAYSKYRIWPVSPAGRGPIWPRDEALLISWRDGFLYILIIPLGQSSEVCDVSKAITQTSCWRADLRPFWRQKSTLDHVWACDPWSDADLLRHFPSRWRFLLSPSPPRSF